MSVVVALFLALFALVTAALGILDLKTFQEDTSPANAPKSRKRISPWGIAKISFALLTFLAVALGEYLKDRANTEAAERERTLRDQVAALQVTASTSATKLDQARKSMETALRKTDGIERSTRGQMVRHGDYRVSLNNEEPEVIVPLRARTGSVYRPKQGDEITWTLYCRRGAIPELVVNSMPPGCFEASYGSLIANGELRQVPSAQGSFVFRGTRQPSEDMVYQVPTGECRPLLIEMRNRMCDLEVRVDRSAGAVRLENLRAGGFAFAGVDGDPLTGDLCAAYDLLYGKTCEQLLKDLERPR